MAQNSNASTFRAIKRRQSKYIVTFPFLNKFSRILRTSRLKTSLLISFRNTSRLKTLLRRSEKLWFCLFWWTSQLKSLLSKLWWMSKLKSLFFKNRMMSHWISSLFSIDITMGILICQYDSGRFTVVIVTFPEMSARRPTFRASIT